MVVIATDLSTAWISVAKRFCTRPTGDASNHATGLRSTAHESFRGSSARLVAPEILERDGNSRLHTKDGRPHEVEREAVARQRLAAGLHGRDPVREAVRLHVFGRLLESANSDDPIRNATPAADK